MRTLTDFSRWQSLSMQPSIRKRNENDGLNAFPYYMIQRCTKYDPLQRINIKQAQSLIDYEMSKKYENDDRYKSYLEVFGNHVTFSRYLEGGKWVNPQSMNTSRFDGKVTSIPETIKIS